MTGGVTSDSPVTLKRITGETLEDILALAVSEAQRAFVASNERAIAQAHFDEGAWFRAIYADAMPVGFVLVHDESLCAEPRQQGYFFLCWRRGEGSAQGFYEKLGFRETGEDDSGEVHAVLDL